MAMPSVAVANTRCDLVAYVVPQCSREAKLAHWKQRNYIGLSYVKGLREIAGQAIIAERNKFTDIDDLARRLLGVAQRDEMKKLAKTGAVNPLNACTDATPYERVRERLTL